MIDTEIAAFLIDGGCGPKKAAAFERYIADEFPAGMGLHQLTRCIRACRARTLVEQGQLLLELQREVDMLKLKLSRWERSALFPC